MGLVESLLVPYGLWLGKPISSHGAMPSLGPHLGPGWLPGSRGPALPMSLLGGPDHSQPQTSFSVDSGPQEERYCSFPDSVIHIRQRQASDVNKNK